jgi:hypothetical protein
MYVYIYIPSPLKVFPSSSVFVALLCLPRLRIKEKIITKIYATWRGSAMIATDFVVTFIALNTSQIPTPVIPQERH